MDDKPLFRIGVAGLDPRDIRLIEIVFRHSQYNPYAYRLASGLAANEVDILIVNTADASGLRALALIRSRPRTIPVIAALPRGELSPSGHAIAIDRLTMQLLPILNRVVEQVPTILVDGSADDAADRPVRGAPAPNAPGATPVAVPAQLRRRALVVDDSAVVREQLIGAFDRMDMDCEALESAHLALERLEQQHFDLALLDVVMPDMDGYKLTREIRRDRRWRRLPVILLTSRTSPFDLARGALAGCNAYLAKPVPFRTLEAAVARQIRRATAVDTLDRR